MNMEKFRVYEKERGREGGGGGERDNPGSFKCVSVNQTDRNKKTYSINNLIMWWFLVSFSTEAQLSSAHLLIKIDSDNLVVSRKY